MTSNKSREDGSESDSGSEDEQELLELLQQQCAASLGVKAKRRRLSPSPEAQEPQSEEEWTGFVSEPEEEETVITFQEPSPSSHEAGSKERYRDFMVCLFLYSVHGLIWHSQQV